MRYRTRALAAVRRTLGATAAELGELLGEAKRDQVRGLTADAGVDPANGTPQHLRDEDRVVPELTAAGEDLEEGLRHPPPLEEVVGLIHPFAPLLMKGFYDTIPRDFEEAVWIDGCTRFQAIYRVLLPQAGPGLAVVAFMTFMFAWGEFMIPLILLRKTDLLPLSIGIYTTFGEHGGVDYGSLSALALIYATPPVLMYLFIRQHLIKGMAGYVK